MNRVKVLRVIVKEYYKQRTYRTISVLLAGPVRGKYKDGWLRFTIYNSFVINDVCIYPGLSILV